MRSAFCALTVVFVLLSAGQVVAQSGEGAMAVADDDARDLEKMTVTGTRLTGSRLDDADPITVVDRATLVDSGKKSLGDFLQELPFMSGSPIGTSVNRRGEGGAFSRGIETVELRGLGPERTLVLLNGRRIVPGGNGASGLVDLAVIPVALVERIEILKTGASVEYGADAVAGVVNVITRDGFDGAEFTANASVTDRGDADTYDVSAVFGRNFERGHVMAGISYFDQAAVSKGDRAFSDTWLTVSGPDNEIVFAGSSAPPSGNFATSNGRLTLIDGEDGDSPEDFRPFIGSGPDSDRFNFNPFEDLLQDSERLSAFFSGRYSLNGATGLFLEALYQERDSDQQLSPLPFFTNREEGVAVAADNVYNPFGERLTDARRRLIEGGPRQFIQDNRLWRVATGIEGSIGPWLWDASITHGRNETDQLQTGDLLDDRLVLALGPSFRNESGQAVCGTPENPVSDCVPLNIFGGAGSITDEMLQYVGAGPLMDHGYNEQTVVNANLSGDLFDLPSGSVAAAFGYEYRDESGADIPDPRTQAGNTTGAARTVTEGSFDSHELYAEFGVPLLRDRPLVNVLELEFGLRGVNFSNFDTESVFDVGLHWRPMSGLTFRASYSDAFRAPNVRELFGGVTQSNPVVEDPCADFSNLGDTQIERCIAQGVPADGSFNQSGNETPSLGGGNPALAPEQGDVLTLGATWRPEWIRGLNLNLDYYDIEITDGIAGIGPNTILEQCLATGAEEFCNRIDRDPTGVIERVRTELQNLASETARGVDFGAEYGHPAWNGHMTHDLLVSYVAERDLVAYPGAEPFSGVGEFDPDNFGVIPRWKGHYRLRWFTDRFDAGYEASYIGSIEESGGEIYPGTVNHVPDRLYHDLSAGYRFLPGARLSLGVDNVADEDPPFLVNGDLANTDVGTYRLLGRTYWLRMEYRL